VSATRRSASPSDAVYAEVLGGTSLPEMKRALERACIERALDDAGGNITKAAELLGMKRPRVSQLVNQFTRDKEVAS
jgi:sigma-54 specific flagellar transcriptional regulator A